MKRLLLIAGLLISVAAAAENSITFPNAVTGAELARLFAEEGAKMNREFEKTHPASEARNKKNNIEVLVKSENVYTLEPRGSRPKLLHVVVDVVSHLWLSSTPRNGTRGLAMSFRYPEYLRITVFDDYSYTGVAVSEAPAARRDREGVRSQFEELVRRVNARIAGATAQTTKTAASAPERGINPVALAEAKIIRRE